MPSVVTQLTRELGFPPPPSASLEGSLGFFIPSPTLPNCTQTRPMFTKPFSTTDSHYYPTCSQMTLDRQTRQSLPLYRREKLRSFPETMGLA